MSSSIMRKNKSKMGFRQALKYVLDVLCFAYYVKSDNLISDTAFDELEKVWKNLFKEETAPMRSIERGFLYSIGVRAVYNAIKSDSYIEMQESIFPIKYKGKNITELSKKELIESVNRLYKKILIKSKRKK